MGSLWLICRAVAVGIVLHGTEIAGRLTCAKLNNKLIFKVLIIILIKQSVLLL